MAVSDPIADMLTRIRNGCQSRLKTVDIPSSKMKLEIAKVLLRHRLIANYKYLDDGRQGTIQLFLKYNEKEQSAISGLKRVSTPGLRIYSGKENIPTVLGGFGLAILSTPKGIRTDPEARKENVGGEVLCYIW
jgi:small subunit ribosomal protein S8